MRRGWWGSDDGGKGREEIVVGLVVVVVNVVIKVKNNSRKFVKKTSKKIIKKGWNLEKKGRKKVYNTTGWGKRGVGVGGGGVIIVSYLLRWVQVF